MTSMLELHMRKWASELWCNRIPASIEVLSELFLTDPNSGAAEMR